MKVAYTVDNAGKTITVKPDENGYYIVYEGFNDITPMFDYLLVEKDDEKKTTDSGLMIPDNAKEKPSTGTVVAVGSGSYTDSGVYIPMAVAVGDRILFPRGVGQTVKFNGVEKTLIKQSSILGIIK